MSNQARPLQPIVAKPTPEDPENSTGKFIANSLNFLLDHTSARSEIEEPEVNPNVNTYPIYDKSKAYVVGDEIRSPNGYFRCVQTIPSNSNVDIADRNYWKLFYMPAESLTAFGGVYDEVNEYPAGIVVIKHHIDQVLVLAAIKLIPENTPFTLTNFKVLEVITL